MNRARTVLPERRDVLWGSVAHVTFKPELWKSGGLSSHVHISILLGYDRRRGHAQALLVGMVAKSRPTAVEPLWVSIAEDV